jgi:hypothetical protein
MDWGVLNAEFGGKSRKIGVLNRIIGGAELHRAGPQSHYD